MVLGCGHAYLLQNGVVQELLMNIHNRHAI